MLKRNNIHPQVPSRFRFAKNTRMIGSTVALSFLLSIFTITALLPSTQVEAHSAQILDCNQATFYVGDENTLNAALGCYNTAVSGTYQIQLTQNITIAVGSTSINNINGATLELHGNGYQIDGGYIHRVIEVLDGDVTISNITLTHGSVSNYVSGGGLAINYSGAYDNCSQGEESPCDPDLTNAPTVYLTNTTVVENYAGSGAGIYNNHGRLTVENSLVTNNNAFNNYGLSGGIYNSGGELTIINSEISGNEGKRNGGGIYSSGGPFTMTGSLVYNNNATNQGGALVGYSDSVFIQNNQFIGHNIIGQAGGLGLYHIENAQILNNVFQGNNAQTGGGLYISDGNNYQIAGNTFISNTATSGSGGGYYSRYITNSTLKDNLFTHNSAVDGGAIKIYTHDSYTGSFERIYIENNLLQGNDAQKGGGIYVDGSGEGYLNNNTITGNEATTNGSGIFVEAGASALIDHATIAGNSTSPTITAVFIEATGSSTATLEMSNSILANGTYPLCDGPLIDNGGNILSDNSCVLTSPDSLSNTDPLLYPLADNGGTTSTFAIPSNSPAIDAAVNSTVSTDQRGVARPQGQGSDSGSFELEGVDLSADFDGSVFTLSWSNDNGCTADVYRSTDAYSGYVEITSDLSDTSSTDNITDDDNYYYFVDVSDCTADTADSRSVGIFNFGLDN